MAFRATCEGCGDYVENAPDLSYVRCDKCLGDAGRIMLERKLKQFRNDRLASEAKPRPVCSHCGQPGAPRLHFRLKPFNWHEERRLLCVPCGKRLGFQPVVFARSTEVHGRESYGRGEAA